MPLSWNGGASAHVVTDASARERFLAHAAQRELIVKAGAAVSVLIADQGFESGGAAISESPAVLAAPVEPTARLLFAAALPEVPPRLSAHRQEQLEAAARRIDHYSAQRGAWIEYACSVLAGWQVGEPSSWVSGPPRSLGALAVELLREANMRRHGALERRRERLRPMTAARQRVEVKRWRAAARQLEAERVGGARSLARPRRDA